MSQKFASGRSVGTRLNATSFKNYFTDKKQDAHDRHGEGEEPSEFKFDPDYKPFWLSHKRINYSVAIFLIIAGAACFALSPFCSSTVDRLCTSGKMMPAIYAQARLNGENHHKIRWIFGLRYIGGLSLGIGIFYLIIIMQFSMWREEMGLQLARHQKGGTAVDGQFNVYDVMVKAWVREHAGGKHPMSRAAAKNDLDDENIPIADAASICSIDSGNFREPSTFTYHW